MSAWIYSIIGGNDIHRFEEIINQEAENGWEPINIIVEDKSGRNPEYYCLARRLKPSREVDGDLMKCPHCKESINDFIYRSAPRNPESDCNGTLGRIYALCCPECNVIISINNYSGT